MKTALLVVLSILASLMFQGVIPVILDIFLPPTYYFEHSWLLAVEEWGGFGLGEVMFWTMINWIKRQASRNSVRTPMKTVLVVVVSIMFSLIFQSGAFTFLQMILFMKYGDELPGWPGTVMMDGGGFVLGQGIFWATYIGYARRALRTQKEQVS